MKALIPIEVIEKKIFLLRGQKVMLDKDLAELYRVETFNLNKAARRNIDRFPVDFMFQLTQEEFQNLIFQFGISSGAKRHGAKGAQWGRTRKLPLAFDKKVDVRCVFNPLPRSPLPKLGEGMSRSDRGEGHHRQPHAHGSDKDSD